MGDRPVFAGKLGRYLAFYRFDGFCSGADGDRPPPQDFDENRPIIPVRADLEIESFDGRIFPSHCLK